MKRGVLGLFALGSLALIGGGLWMKDPALALIVVGALVWIDLQMKSHKS
jgi:hypothetical protein